MRIIILGSLILILQMSKIFAVCEELPLPTSNIIEVNPGDDLRSIVLTAPKGSVILLNSGIYNITSNIFMNQDSITLMSKAQHRDSVILDGNMGGTNLNPEEFVEEIVAIRGSGSTLAHISICHAKYHGIHVYPPSSAIEDISGIRMYDVHVYDCGQQLIKVNSNGNVSNLQWADRGVLECSLIEFMNNSVMQEEPGYFYTGGIDVHGGENWIIRNNVFKNIERDAKLMEHAVHFWSKSRGTLIENNTFINVYRGIGLGMKTEDGSSLEKHYDDGEGDNPYFDHIDGIIRNNVLYNEAGIHLESGIELMNVKNVQVYNNTIFCEDQPFNSIEYRWPNTTVIVKNNIFSHNMMPRNEASFDTAANIENASSTLFKDVKNYDFHLVESADLAIGKGFEIPDSLFGLDMDFQKPNGSFDIGADQINGTGINFLNSYIKDKSKGLLLTNIKILKNGIKFNSIKQIDAKVTIYDVMGKSVYQDKKVFDGAASFIDMSTISKGVYLLKISNRKEECLLKLLWQ